MKGPLIETEVKGGAGGAGLGLKELGYAGCL